MKIIQCKWIPFAEGSVNQEHLDLNNTGPYSVRLSAVASASSDRRATTG
jgi:hypothetical protein